MAKPPLTLIQVASRAEIFRLPRVVAFNRLESRPRTLDFTRSLRAEVRDPLWMLTRQWQFGEFKGEDAASAVTSRIHYQHQKVDRVRLPDNTVFPFDPSTMPLEARVEREPIPLTVREDADGAVFSDVVAAIQWGKLFLKMLQDAGLDANYSLYLEKFPIRVLPKDPLSSAARDPEAEQIRASVEGRIADGVAIWRAVQAGTHDPWLDAQAVPNTNAIKAIAAAFAQGRSQKLQRLFTQPEDPGDSAWVKNHLEYNFSAAGQSTPETEQPVLLAEQYHGGRLDWYSFDVARNASIEVDPEPPPAEEPEQIESFLPGHVRFKGQPQPRFWEMEETQTDFGKIETSTTGLLHLMLAEFGLIYSNDWFMLPHPMPINTVCEIRGILVDDTFGRHTLIRPAGRGPETAWQRWAMFHLADKGAVGRVGAFSRFYLVPAVGKVLESEPLERVNFMRDEMANMVWGVESIIPSQIGQGMRGYNSMQEKEPEKPLAASDDVKIQYVLGTTVPINWIPFIPVHAENSISEIRLQRARMAGGEPPRGRLLREARSPYFIEEEEVPRTGVYVERSWQRARWLGGRTILWIGRRKTAGRGEGWSQLVFDRIVDLAPPAE
jgi:hypothetical protein